MKSKSCYLLFEAALVEEGNRLISNAELSLLRLMFFVKIIDCLEAYYLSVIYSVVLLAILKLSSDLLNFLEASFLSLCKMKEYKIRRIICCTYMIDRFLRILESVVSL